MIKLIALTHICANYTYNHVLYDVCTQTDCIKCAIVCTKKYNLFETFSCFVLDFFLSLQPKIDTN